jgi:UDP-glucuronate 4-epimerase
MTILVTGAAGFIGMRLAERLLARGERVIGVDDCNDYYAVSLKLDRIAHLQAMGGERFSFVRQDFADMAALDAALAPFPVTAIAHLGAQAGVRHSLTHPHAYTRANLVGHLNLLEVARAREVPMVYASSSSVYGNNKKQPFSVDDRVDHPISLYAATKKADELMSESYAHLYRIPLTGLRFFTVYGPWGRPDMAMWGFTEKILNGEPIELFNGGDMRRDFTFIDDIVSGLLSCLDRPPADDGAVKPGGSLAPHAIYNIGNNRPEPLERMVTLLEQACGRTAQRILKPMQPGDVHETYADIAAIQRDHGYAPTTTLEQGIPLFVDWYRAYQGV